MALKRRQGLREHISIPATAGEATTIGYVASIEDITEENTDFRRVLYSGSKLQLVVMSVAPGKELGGETHEDTDQSFRVEHGKGMIMIDGVAPKVKAGDGGFLVAFWWLSGGLDLSDRQRGMGSGDGRAYAG